MPDFTSEQRAVVTDPELPPVTVPGRELLARIAASEDTVYVYREPSTPGADVGRRVLDRLLRDQLVFLGDRRTDGRPLRLTPLGHAVLQDPTEEN